MSEALRSETDEAVQRKWLVAENMAQRVTAIISMEMRRTSSEAIDKVASGLRSMVSKMEKGLRSINQFQLQESIWPVNNMVVCALDAGGPQLEAAAMMTPDNQQVITV